MSGKIDESNAALIANEDGDPCTLNIRAKDDGGIAVLGMPRIFVPLKPGGPCKVSLYCDHESLARLALQCMEALVKGQETVEVTLDAHPFTVSTGRFSGTWDDGTVFEAGETYDLTEDD